MIRNYITSALRTIWSHRGYAAINILGLAIGIAACFLMVLFIKHELSYDRFHRHADRMYRLNLEISAGSSNYHLADTPGPVGPALKETFPEVEVAARIKAPGETLVAYGDERFEEQRFYYAEPEVLDIFSMEVVRGDARSTLATPESVLLTESSARKIFGEVDPVGEILRINEKRQFRIGGVLRDPPPNTHFPYDFLGSFVSLKDQPGERLEEWGTVGQYYTYFLLAPGTSPTDFAAKLDGMREKHLPESFKFSLQPVTDIHLRSSLGNELQTNGDIRYIFLFAGIAVFILLLACINFMNLATARATTRMKEVGVRKVLGASRPQLAWQFLGESFVFSFTAVLLAVLLTDLFLPALNTITGRDLQFHLATEPTSLLMLAGIGLVVAVVAGSYPAFVLSAFRPIGVLKETRGLDRGALFRKGLVVFQFAVSSSLLIGTFIIYEQMTFLQNTKLGFDHDQILVIELRDRELRSRYAVLKELLEQDANVLSVAGSSSVPGGGYSAYFARAEGMADDQPMVLPYFWVGDNFQETYGLELSEGRWPAPGLGDDSTRMVVVNETGVRQFGWQDALGKRIEVSDFTAIVTGVVRDFHFASLHETIQPVVLEPSDGSYSRVSVRLSPGDHVGMIERLEEAWSAFAPAYPFKYSFLDQDLDELYASEHRLSRASAYFSVLAVLIACLGLLGLAAFTAGRRTKEIGIRKVMGASVSAIMLLLSKEFVRLVLVGFLVAVPLAYLTMNKWLEDFAYHVEMSPNIFLISGIVALSIGLAAVAYQTIRAAVRNPVESLRYE